MTSFLDLPPLLSAHGTVRLPGSKSISNRMLLLAALSNGVTEIRDLLHSDDTEHMLDALRTLGVAVESVGSHAYCIQGCAGNFPNKKAVLFLGNAGTAFRPLTAVLALAGGEYQLSGVARMHERPIADLVGALRKLGADITYLGTEGFPPLGIRPAVIHPAARVSVRGDVSSQFLTALLMAAPLAQQDMLIEVEGELISKPYIEITLNMMAQFGVRVERNGWISFMVRNGSQYKSPGVVFVEGDASSASYFLAAGAIGGGPVRVEGVGKNSIQGDVRFAEALQAMGAHVELGENWIGATAPVEHGLKHGKLRGIDLDCNHIPDAAMTLAVCALFAEGTTTLRNIASWRVKETDRIHAMATELRKVGATVDEGADFIRITPPAKILHAAIDTYDDHRMAMCFSLAAFGGAGLRINNPQCVAKTFPDYFARFAEVVQPVPVIAIDGPSASGKGTVAQQVAQALGFHYLDSGALYRLLALAAQRQGIALNAAEQLAKLAAEMQIRFAGADIWLNEVLVGQELRSEQTAAAASTVAAFPAVRAALLHKQHAFRRAPGLVADGRDMASVVFPDAKVKIFLTASADARAERRYKQLMGNGSGLMRTEMDATIANLLQEIRVRDERDMQRSVAPLQQAVGASLLDTTNLTVAQAVQVVLKSYRALES
ncbi:MAG: bifunctional 3-phosphoshikimate 1-carboxyvinyltransferase/cytidylate kinase [Candidatus Nitrotoga sp.]